MRHTEKGACLDDIRSHTYPHVLPDRKINPAAGRHVLAVVHVQQRGGLALRISCAASALPHRALDERQRRRVVKQLAEDRVLGGVEEHPDDALLLRAGGRRLDLPRPLHRRVEVVAAGLQQLRPHGVGQARETLQLQLQPVALERAGAGGWVPVEGLQRRGGHGRDVWWGARRGQIPTE